MHEYINNRGYRTLINVAVLSGIGDGLYNIVFVIYASTLPFKTLAVSLASMATLIPSLLSMVTGYFADQARSKTKSMIFARLIQFGLFLGLAVAIKLPASLPLFLLLLMINIVSDTCGSFGNGLALPLLRRLLPTSELNGAMGFMTAATTTVQVIFQGIGASLIVLLNHNYALFGVINALTFLSAALLIIQRQSTLLQVESVAKHAHAPEDGSIFHSLKQTLSFLRTNRFLLTVIILTFFINLFGASISGLINVTLLAYKGLWLGNYGNSVAVMNISISAGMIVGSLWTNDWFKKIRLMMLFVWCLSFSILAGLGFIWHQTPWLIIVALLGMGYLLGKVNPRISAIVLHSVPEHRLAAVNGLLTMVSMLGAPIGQVVFLGVANVVDVSWSWLGFTIGCGLIVLFIIFGTSQMKEPALIDD